jgi:hypothetical protein
MSTAQARIISWRPWRNPAGTVLGFLSAQMPSGLVIHGLKLMIGPAGKHWVAMPATKREAADGGKAAWDPIIEFADREARDRFGAGILAALREQHPDAFEQGELL